MKLVFEKSSSGRKCDILPSLDVDKYELSSEFTRNTKYRLPEMAENDISRNYTEVIKNTHGVNDGFYPLGSCTMKYNPKINDEMASLDGFKNLHPLQAEHTVQGALEALYLAEEYLTKITGMDRMSFQPAAGAHGELTGLLLIKAYHEENGDFKRNKIIVPDSAHGTNPASATMVGYLVVTIPSREDGLVDIDKLKEAVGDDTAGLMLTNPSTAGLFEKEILEITSIVHESGGLIYYDGANLNAVVGLVRPGDMGFDVIHLNLHKTFSTPHGGGGPGSGPVGCKDFLAKYLPSPWVTKKDDSYKLVYDNHTSIGTVKSFYGNFLVVLRALTYILQLGEDGLKDVAKNAVLNANYMMHHLQDTYDVAFDGPCMHEFVISVDSLKKETGVTALDVAKALLDYGIHPPTMYFPLIIPEALMIEPTETESRETLDEVIGIFKEIYKRAKEDPDDLKASPKTTYVGRLDEVRAARNPILKYDYKN